VNEILRVQSRDKQEKTFYYSKDWYACILLREILKLENDVRAIKKTKFSKLMNRPVVKHKLSKRGGAKFFQEDLIFDQYKEALPFNISFGRWGCGCCHSQTSRKSFNLVIRLDFSSHHAENYEKHFKPKEHNVFNYSCHPVRAKSIRKMNSGRRSPETMAWSRVDIDLRRNVALIEEIQTDWLRGAKDELDDLIQSERSGYEYVAWGSESKTSSIKYYLSETLKPYNKLWAEAMLAVTIKLLLDDLNMNSIYYHTPESGRLIKRIEYGAPPRSLYTSLPKRFCFKQTQYGPDFIEKTRSFKKFRSEHPYLSWQKLDIKGEFYAKQKQKIAQAA